MILILTFISVSFLFVLGNLGVGWPWGGRAEVHNLKQKNTGSAQTLELAQPHATQEQMSDHIKSNIIPSPTIIDLCSDEILSILIFKLEQQVNKKQQITLSPKWRPRHQL